jgi:hypothetical protein
MAVLELVNSGNPCGVGIRGRRSYSAYEGLARPAKCHAVSVYIAFGRPSASI